MRVPLATFVCLALMACGGGEHGHRPRADLVRLFPRTAAGQEVLALELGTPAARHYLEGWAAGEPLASGEMVARLVSPEASVRLEMRGSGVRRLVLRCGVIGAADAALLGVRVGGRQVAWLRLARGLADHTVELPGQVRGAVAADVVLLSKPGTDVACASIRVERPDADGRRPALVSGGRHEALVIPGGTRVDYFLRLPRQATLRGRLRPDGGGAALRVVVARDGQPDAIVLDGAGEAGRFGADLGPFDDAVVRLTLEAHGPGALRLEQARVIGTEAPPVPAPPRPARRPNVLLYVIDTLRADHLGCYGYARDTSPHIDALAADGLLFAPVVAQASWTTPAVASILTGRYPQHHGAVSLTAGLRPGIPLLPELLRAQGYATAAFVTNVNVRGEIGFRRGFDEYHYFPERKRRPTLHLPAVELTERAAAWIAGQGRAPFFVYVHASDPHAPYAPPAALAARFAPHAPPALAGARDPLRLVSERRSFQTPENVAYLRDLYDGDVAAVDEGFGRLVAELRRLDLYDDTLIVLVADHGEEFGEHGGLEHGSTLYREVIDVPLVIRLPDGARRGRVETLARQVDVLPTVLEELGLPPPDGIDGRSLLTASWDATVEALSHTALGPTVRSALVTRRWKVIAAMGPRRGGGTEIYEIDRDPEERRNVAPSAPVMAGYASEILEDWARRLVRTAQAGGALAPDQDTMRRLRALGYLR